jgi:glycosyltransferase involved in cell wall biosynthesis
MEKKQVKVLFIVPTLNPGGIETYLLRFLKFIQKDQTIKSYILVRSLNKGVLYEQYETLEIPIYFQPLGYFKLQNIKWYFQFFKKHQFDTVCDFNANFAGIPMWLSEKADIKNRITFYRQGKNHFKSSLIKSLYNQFVKRLVLKSSTQILSNSKAALDYFYPNRGDDERFKVIYNGMNVNDFIFAEKRKSIRAELQIPENAFVICHSGRLDPAKNHSTILKVAKKLIDADKNIFFILCGLSTEQLQEEVSALGVANNIRLLGFREDVPQILNESDLFYFPSITEGQPNALIEAMLVGLPFVASNIAPIEEIIPSDFRLLLINAFDVEEACKLIIAIKSKDLNMKFARIQRWATDNFSQEQRFKEFYHCLIN